MRVCTRCSEAGAAGILTVTPYYNRPSQAGLVHHFGAVAGATDLPVILYDIPTRSGRKIDTDTILRLADEVDNIVAVKDAAGNLPETARLIAAAPDGFEVYSGEDALTLALLALGAVGTISVASHWCGPETAALMDAFFDGDVAGGINAARHDSRIDMCIGTGGSPEGVATACAVKALGGFIQGRLAPGSDDEREKGEAAGLLFDHVYEANDLVRSDNTFFVATGVTDGELVRGVRREGEIITTESIVLRSRSGTVRRVIADHLVAKWLDS